MGPKQNVNGNKVTTDLSNLSMDDLLKIQAELETRKTELEKARSEKLTAVFPKVTELFVSNGISLSPVQIEAIKTIASGPTSTNAGAFVATGKALYQAGLKAHRSYEKIGEVEVMFQYRAKSKKTRKAKTESK